MTSVKSNGTRLNYTDEISYLHHDHLGSAVAGTDANGAILWTEKYTPFGIALVNNAANDNQAGFTGHLKDTDTGLTYMQARYYDPVVSRFLSVDPVGFLDTGQPGYFNRYGYAFNNPINNFDPTGMSCEGVEGPCLEAGNFKEKKADADLNLLASSANDAAVSSSAAGYAVEGEERGFRVDGDSTSAAGKPGQKANGTATVGFKPSEVSGADAFGHSHDPNVKAEQSNFKSKSPGLDGLNLGPGDAGASVKLGLPGYVTHGERAIVFEIKNGHARVRTISGQMTNTERKITQKRLNRIQSKIQ